MKKNQKIIKKEYQTYSNKDPKKAQRRFKTMHNNLNNLPSVISTFIRRLNKHFDKTINFMIHDFYTFNKQPIRML